VAGPTVPRAEGASGAAAPTSQALADYAERRWEALLLFFSNDDAHDAPELPDVLARTGLEPLSPADLLAAAGLRQEAERGALLRGHDARFEFLMKPRAAQLWQVVRGYVSRLASRAPAGGGTDTDIVSAARLLLQAAFMEPGQPYPMGGLPAGERRAVGHLCQLGVFLPLDGGAGGGTAFCATHLARVLAGEGPGDAGGGAAGSPIVTETNFKVYAYTSSRVQHSVLQQFCRTDCVLPNLYVGSITYQSLDAAFNRGLDAASIVRYLEQHAHPKQKRVPRAVDEQIRLWETAVNRVRKSDVHLYHNFETPAFFEATWRHALSLGGGCLQYPPPGGAGADGRPACPYQLAEGEGEEVFRKWPLVVARPFEPEVSGFIRANKARFVAGAGGGAP